MKKKIVVGSFLALILITVIFFIIGVINTYNYEVANDDIMVGLGAAMVLVVGGFVVFYELDLFYTVYYFLVKPKTLAKSILNVVSNVTLLSIVFTDAISHFLYKHVSEIFGEEIILSFALFFTYVILRVASIVIPTGKYTKEN